MALTIRKTIEGEFEHIRSDGTVLDGSPNATAIGSSVNFKTRNGARIALREPISGITVIDVASASNETFSTTTELFIRLRALGYFNQGGGTLTGGSNTFQGLTDTVVALPYVDNQIPIAENGNLVMKDIPNAFGVSSWNGFTGNVNVNTANLPEDPNGLVNLYFTDARVSANADVIANSTHRNRTDNPHNVTASQVNLGNVDNTSDINKPISTAQEVRYQSIESKIAIIRNGNFATLANVQADTSLQTDITDNAGVPLAVFNEDGRIFIYNAGSWKENGADEVFVSDNVASFPATGDLDTLYKVRGATPELYNWDGAAYILVSQIPTDFLIDGTNDISNTLIFQRSVADQPLVSVSGTNAGANAVLKFGNDLENIGITVNVANRTVTLGDQFGTGQQVFLKVDDNNANIVSGGATSFLLNDTTPASITLGGAKSVMTLEAVQALLGSGLTDGDNQLGNNNNVIINTDGATGVGSSIFLQSNDNAGSSTQLDISGGEVNMETYASTDRTGNVKSRVRASFNEASMFHDGIFGDITFRISSAGVVLTDGNNARGINYAADYSANYTPRTLVDKGHLDSVVTGASGSFTAQSGETVTVVNGLITSIV